MIEKLRKRFICIALIALTASMILVTVVINVVNWADVRSELEQTLSILSETGGIPPEAEGNGGVPRWADRSRHQRNMLNESRFFTGILGEDGAVHVLNRTREDSATEEEVTQLITRAAETGSVSGSVGDYFFRAARDARGGTRYVFLNAETKLSSVRRLILFSVIACAAGILLAMIAVIRFSRKAIEPILKNEKQQKQFITDASHELKTPLTVISANMDVLSQDVPDNPWVLSTRKQVANMRRLTDELVYLSRLEENDRPLEMKTFSLRPVLEDVAEPFAAMAEFQGRRMEISAEDGLSLTGDEDAVRRMISTLCDNAVKYSPEEGSIRVEAKADGRHVLLRFSNTVEKALTREQCERLFQRFYRADESRSKEKKSGFGIGLSIAAAVAEKHGGTLTAAMDGDTRLVITCRLPRSAA